ncbi:MAG: peptidase, partial [Verrucomicrobiales bacterium]
QYECHHGWGAVPEHIKWRDTHGIAVDEEGLVYVKHNGGNEGPMDTIVVFEPGTGKFVRSFGQEYVGGGHGIDIRKEEGQEYLYLSDTKNGLVAKTNLKGEQIWTKSYPVDCGFYGVKQRFSPTNIAFAPDGGFYVADGYGSSYIHQYDRNDNWVRSWGGKGKRIGTMSTPH